MKKLAFLSIVLLLSACGSKIDGNYVDNLGVGHYTFSNGKLIVTAMGTKGEGAYKVDGNQVSIQDPRGIQTWTILSDGSLEGPGGLKLTKQ
jgi:protein involved in sex pheromone biosynthesis